MELSDLRIFQAVVQEGGVTRAAERMHRVQSNVSTRIRHLEEDLGVKLFIREGKRFVLAPAGRILFDYAERLLDLAGEARDAVQDENPRGLFRLGSMESTAAVRLPAPLAVFSRRYPTVRLELRTGNPVQLSEAVLAGEVDAALVAEPIATASFDAIAAFEEEPVLVAAASGSSPDGPIEVPRTIIVFEHGCPHRRLLEAWFSARQEVPEHTIELGSYHAMLGCVLAGMGAAVLPKSVLQTFPEVERLHIQPLAPGSGRLTTFLIWRKGVPSPSVAALAGLLRSGGSGELG